MSARTQANLQIRVNVVQVVMTEQNPTPAPQAAVSYSVSAVQPRTSVTKEIRNIKLTRETLKAVEITTVVVE